MRAVDRSSLALERKVAKEVQIFFVRRSTLLNRQGTLHMLVVVCSSCYLGRRMAGLTSFEMFGWGGRFPWLAVKTPPRLTSIVDLAFQLGSDKITPAYKVLFANFRLSHAISI